MYSVTRICGCHASDTLRFAMHSSVFVFHRNGCRKLALWLLGQPGRLAPSRSRGSLGPPFGAFADLLPDGWRRSQVCGGASLRPVWVRCPTIRRSSSIRAGASLSLPSSDLLCSSGNGSASIKMSSSSFTTSSSTSNGQGKSKAKSPLHKRGSLQSTTSPGE